MAPWTGAWEGPAWGEVRLREERPEGCSVLVAVEGGMHGSQARRLRLCLWVPSCRSRVPRLHWVQGLGPRGQGGASPHACLPLPHTPKPPLPLFEASGAPGPVQLRGLLGWPEEARPGFLPAPLGEEVGVLSVSV